MSYCQLKIYLNRITSVCLTWPAPSAFFCCARPLNRHPKNSKKPHVWKAVASSACCGGYMCPWHARLISCLWAGLHQPPLEQFPVAPGRDQFGGNPALDGWTGYLRRPGIRRGLVDYHRGHFNVRGPAAHRLSAVPKAIRSVLHARGH